MRAMAPRSEPPAPPARDAAPHGDRAAFQAAVAPYRAELFAAARRELRYRIALGQLAADDLTPAELVGETLLRAWRDRRRRPPHLGVKAWLLALLLRVGREIAAREARLRRRATVSLEAPPPPAPIYDDDEEFWEWYQPDEATRWEDVVAADVAVPEEVATADEELIRGLDPHMREMFLLCELHRLPLDEAAAALGLPLAEAARLLEEARRRLGLTADKNLP